MVKRRWNLQCSFCGAPWCESALPPPVKLFGANRISARFTTDTATIDDDGCPHCRRRPSPLYRHPAVCIGCFCAWLNGVAHISCSLFAPQNMIAVVTVYPRLLLSPKYLASQFLWFLTNNLEWYNTCAICLYEDKSDDTIPNWGAMPIVGSRGDMKGASWPRWRTELWKDGSLLCTNTCLYLFAFYMMNLLAYCYEYISWYTRDVNVKTLFKTVKQQSICEEEYLLLCYCTNE